MSTAGEAASLFGASDPSGDLFGDAVGSNVETSTHSVGPDPFSGQETTSFFDEVNSSSDTSTFTSNHAQSEAPSGSYGQSWVNTNGNQHEGYAQVVDGYSTHYSRQPYANGWNEQQAQWSVYEQQQQQQEATSEFPFPDPPNIRLTVYHAVHSTTNTSQPILQHSYDPYAPPPSQSVASISTGYYAPPAPKQRAVTAPPYNPYAPTTSAYAHQLTSQSQGVPPQAIYGPYTPAHPTVLQEPVHQRELSVDRTQVHIKKSSVGSSISSIAASVPPPLPSASAYRPKVTNAYDPPLPPPKPARRSHATPPVVQYPAQSPFVLPSSSPVPTPPPPRGRSAAGHYDSSPLPRRPSVYPPAPLPSSQGLHTHDSQLAPPPQEHFVDHHVPQPSYGHLPPNGYAGERWPVPPQASATNDASDPAQYFSPPLNHSEPYNIGSSGPEHPEPKENLSISDHDELISPSPLEHHIPQASSHPLPSSTYQAPVGSIEDTVAEIGIPEECDVIQRDAFASTEETLGLPANPPSGTTIDDIEGLPSVSSLPGLQHYAFQQAPHDPYKPLAGSPPSSPPYHRPPERARTPGSSSGRSWTSPTKSSVVPPARKSSGFSPPPPAPRDRSGSGRFIAPSSPYNPEILHRTVSPSALSIHSVHAQDVIHDSLPSSEIVEGFPPSRNRSMSSSSTLSISASTRDPYAPLQRSSLSSVYEPSTSSQTLADISSTLSTTHQGSEFQLPALMTLPQQAPYAPSPSLLGTNDPLGRTSVRVPIVTFGFGGKIVTCFHGLSTLSTGFDVALSSRQSTDVQIRILHQVIPESVVETSVAQFPGPLFCDPSNTTSIVRAGTTTQTKTKKGLVVKYLEERSSEISRGLGYLHQDSLEGHRAEAKRVLILLLKVMVENDGRLSGRYILQSYILFH